MIYREPGFPAVVWFGSSPAPFFPISSVICVSFSVFLCVEGQANWQDGGGDVGGAKSNNGETAWSAINHSILSGFNYTCSVSLSSKALSRRRASSKDPVLFRGQQQKCRLLSFYIKEIIIMILF